MKAVAREALSLEQPNQAFINVLMEFATAISQGGVRASLRPTTASNRQNLVLAPVHQPGFSIILANVIFQGGVVKLLGQTIATPAALEQALVVFAQSAEVQQSIHEIHAISQAPVEGNLREGIGEIKDTNILVEVSPAEQKKLDCTLVGDPVNIQIKWQNFQGNPTIEIPNQRYHFLSSAGLYLKIDEIILKDGDNYTLVGHRYSRE